MLIPVIFSDKFPGYGIIAGALPDGLVTFTPPGAPGVAQLDLFDYETRERLRFTWSTHEGKYAFDGLPSSGSYGVWARDPTGAFEDMVAGRVSPYVPLQFNAAVPFIFADAPLTFSYEPSSGAPPYTFAVTDGALPSGLVLDVNTGVLSGTTSASGAYSFEVTITDARAASVSRTDSGTIALTFRFYRIYITAASGGYGSMTELEFLDPSGVRLPLAGGSPIQSSEYNSAHNASYAFDGIVVGDVGWAPTNSIPPMYIGYEHAAVGFLGAVRITARQTANSQAPNAFDVQSSSDGVTWTTEWSVSGQTGWGANEARTFSRPP